MSAANQPPGDQPRGHEELRRELRELLSMYCDGTANPAQVERLEQFLDAAPSAGRPLLDYLQLDAELRFMVQGQRALGRSLDAIFAPSSAIILDEEPAVSASIATGNSPGDGPLPAKQAASATPAAKSPVLGFLGGVVDYVSHSRTLMFWLIGGTLGLYFAVQLGSLLVSRFWAQNAPQLADQRGAGTEERGDDVIDPAGLGGAPGAKIVARLTNAIDCRWHLSRHGGTNRIDQAESVALDLGSNFHAGQKLNLTAGLAELTFVSGAKVILHAPAQFAVSDRLSGHLVVCRLTGKVPHSAAGFTINTPGGKVVDLGTEFGVKVNDDRTMHVIVYVGEVVVDSGSGAAGEPKYTVHVKAGEAIVMAPGQPAKSTPAQEEQFIRDLAPFGNKAEVEAAYVEFVKKLKPAVWFRMEGNDADRVVHDEMNAARDGELRWDGDGNPFVHGRVGKGLWLRGDKLGDHAYVADYPKAEHGKLTVSAWAYAETRNDAATIAANWRANHALGQFQLLLFSDGPGDTANLDVRITANDGKFYVEAAEGKSHPFPLSEWQHVAFTTDGSTLRLYRQGREVASAKHAGLKYPSPIPSLAIGCTFDQSDRKPGEHPGYWDGKLDEVMIFNDTLSGEEIQKLANFVVR